MLPFKYHQLRNRNTHVPTIFTVLTMLCALPYKPLHPASLGRVARTTLRVLSLQENRSASTNRSVKTARSHAEGAPPSVCKGGSWVFLSRFCVLFLSVTKPHRWQSIP